MTRSSTPPNIPETNGPSRASLQSLHHASGQNAHTPTTHEVFLLRHGARSTFSPHNFLNRKADVSTLEVLTNSGSCISHLDRGEAVTARDRGHFVSIPVFLFPSSTREKVAVDTLFRHLSSPWTAKAASIEPEITLSANASRFPMNEVAMKVVITGMIVEVIAVVPVLLPNGNVVRNKSKRP